MILLALFAPLAAPLQDGDLADRLDFHANGRLRWESTFDQPNGADRHRGRMRARVGAGYELAEGVRVEGRLSTISDGGDSNNPHWDFGDGTDGFNGGDVVLDRYYLAWEAGEDLELRGGKQPHVFQGPPVLSELVWDADVQPSGFTAIYSGGGDGSLAWDVRGAAYVAVESSGGHDATMFGGQANVQLDATEELELALGSALYGWGGLAGFGGTLGNQGNTDVTGHFQVWDTFLAASSEAGPMGGWQAFGQFINNTATGTEDQGFGVGARLGRGSSEGDANVFLAYYDLDADALFSPVAQDDTPIAGTGSGAGMEGIVLGGQYHVRDNLSLKLWLLTSDDGTDEPFRIRFDLDFRVR